MNGNVNVNRINQSNNYNLGLAKIEREYSALRLQNTRVGTGDMGLLIPGLCRELIPGQRVALSQKTGIQMNPLVSTLFTEIYGERIWVFAPYRILWPSWETFITGDIDGQDETALPTLSLSDMYTDAGGTPGDLDHTLADYFDMPINANFADGDFDDEVQPLAFLWYAYNAWYNEHIRIPDFEPTEIDDDNNVVLRGNNDFDYFVRARVYRQRGVVPSVPVSEELQMLEHEIQSGSLSGTTWSEGVNAGFAVGGAKFAIEESDDGDDVMTYYGSGTSDASGKIMPHSMEAFGVDLNDFMISMGIMRYQINNAKIMPRYIEHLQMRWGISPQDCRLARPEFLGSETFPCWNNPVTQTSYGNVGGGETPQGNMTGQGWGLSEWQRVNYEAQEHGILMSIFIIKPKRTYDGGLDRMWRKQNRFDFPTPELVHMPDREVYTYELFWQGIEDKDNAIFGWQCIFEEYRTMFNKVNGKLRPTCPNGLPSYTLADYWEHDSEPVLNKTFVECDPDQDRIFQITTEPAFIYSEENIIETAIPLPVQSDPSEFMQGL